MAKKRVFKTEREMNVLVRGLLDEPIEDRELLTRLEALARERAFGGLTWLWGPQLYERNRAMFRPFILTHFSEWRSGRRWTWVAWKGEAATALESWLTDVDRLDDVQLFRRLLSWKLTNRLTFNHDRQWCEELTARFREARSPAERATVLEKFDSWFRLDEATAVALYETDRCLAAPFILKHLPSTWRRGPFWSRLSAAAESAADEEFRLEIYRRQCPLATWEKDTLELCQTIPDPNALCDELERRHPKGYGLDLGRVLFKLVERRRRDVLPYVLRHVRDVWSHWYRSGYDKLLELARREHWLDLWATLVRISAGEREFSSEVRRLLDEAALSDEEKRRRLVMIAGVSREFNLPGLGLATVHGLDDATAMTLYARFPELVRGPLKLHVEPTWGRHYERFIGHLIDVGDEELLDFMASRFVTRTPIHLFGDRRPTNKGQLHGAETLSRYYESVREQPGFSRRAAAVLTQVPAYTIYRYHELIRTNRLARLLFERSARSYLNEPDAVRDLVEGSEIHVQALGYRILALDDDRARELAGELLEILQGTLLRPLHRTTRLAAFEALFNAASSEDAARRILNRAREAMDLPDIRYPKEPLVGLIGRILHRQPGMRGPSEQPVIYEYAEVAS